MQGGQGDHSDSEKLGEKKSADDAVIEERQLLEIDQAVKDSE